MHVHDSYLDHLVHKKKALCELCRAEMDKSRLILLVTVWKQFVSPSSAIRTGGDSFQENGHQSKRKEISMSSGAMYQVAFSLDYAW